MKRTFSVDQLKSKPLFFIKFCAPCDSIGCVQYSKLVPIIEPMDVFTLVIYITAQKTKFSIEGFFRKCDQIRRKLRIWSHLLKKSLMEIP